jgi:carboxymethylenebutenolidase
MRTTDEYEGMIAETTAIRAADGTQILAYYARPTGPGPYPAVILFHHRPGWDEWYRETTRRFAHHGYLAISPDLYFRSGQGQPDDVAARASAQGGVPDDQVVGDAAGCLDFLRALPIASGKVGLFVTYSGGRHAYLTACRIGTVDAVVDCWGGRIVADEAELTTSQPVAPVDHTPDLPCPVLGLFGNDDTSPSPKHVDTLEATLREQDKEYEFHRYDGAGHGFFYYDRPSAYRAEAAVDGWTKIWDFLGRTLG